MKRKDLIIYVSTILFLMILFFYFTSEFTKKEKIIDLINVVEKTNYEVKEDDSNTLKIYKEDLINTYDSYYNALVLKIEESRFSSTKKVYIDNYGEKRTDEVNVGNIDVEPKEYAVAVAKCFAFDFFDWSDKKSATDIGGLEFVFPEKENVFFEVAAKTYYKNFNTLSLENNEFSFVEKVEVLDVEDMFFDIGDSAEFKGYRVTLRIDYYSEYELPTKTIVDLIEYFENVHVINVQAN